MIYISLILLLVISSYYYDYKKGVKAKRFVYFGFFVVFVLLVGLRYRLGLDSTRYEEDYNNFPTISNLTVWTQIQYPSYQPLFILLFSLSKTLCPEFYFFQIVHATIINGVIFWFIKKYSNNVFFCLLLYFFYEYFNFNTEILRESIAVVIFLMSYGSLKNKNFIKFYIYISIAFLFHTSAIILTLLPPVLILFKNKLVFNKWSWLNLILVFIGGYILQKVLFDYLLMFDVYEGLTNRINRYNGSSYSNQHFNLMGIISVFLGYLFYAIYSVDQLKKKNIKLAFQFEPYVYIAVVFLVLQIPIYIFYRFVNYFFMFALILMSNIVYKNKTLPIRIKSNPMIWILFYSLGLYFQASQFLPLRSHKDISADHFHRVYPYENVITKEKNSEREKYYFYYE